MAKPDPPPFLIEEPLDPLVQKLKHWLEQLKRLNSLDDAVKQALTFKIKQMQDWKIENGEKFLQFASGMLKWVPSENVGGKEIYSILCLFYFVFNQHAINDLQTRIDTESIGKGLTCLSQWVSEFAQKVGRFMDQPESLTAQSYQTFVDSPRFNLDEAQVPNEGEGKGFNTFNEFFARHLKDGKRPVSCPQDDRVIVYPADSTFDGAWDIKHDGTVHIDTYQIQTAEIKGLDWPISALLDGCDYAHKYNGGKWMHAFLNTYDYHRQHAPVSGTVVEAKVIPGLAYFNVKVTQDSHGHNILKPHRSYKARRPAGHGGSDSTNDDVGVEMIAPDDAGYQFLQARGCITIDNPTVGYVSVLPIGMAQVSSVKLAVQKGDPVKKGQEISHFEFGGSDCVLVFQASAEVVIFGNRDENSGTGQKYLVGEVLGYANGSRGGDREVM